MLLLLSHFSCVQPCTTTWTAHPPSMGFSRQEYWSGVPLPSPILRILVYIWASQVVLVVKNPTSISGLGRSPGIGNGMPLQYSCLENSLVQRNLVGCSPWDCKELDITEGLNTKHKCIYVSPDLSIHPTRPSPLY